MIYGHTLQESYLINQKDIYYNKDKFDSGEINLCFITGHSGGGKSTMGDDYAKDNKIEHYDMDDLQCTKDHFSMDNLKEYGDLIYQFFSGKGKKFYLGKDDITNIPGEEYEDKLYIEFVNFAKQYAKTHRDRKYILEGVWLFCNKENGTPYFQPEEFKDYAFFIKGTSMIISKHRATVRDVSNDNDGKFDLKNYLRSFLGKNWKWYFIDEKRINKFRSYFNKLMEKNKSK